MNGASASRVAIPAFWRRIAVDALLLAALALLLSELGPYRTLDAPHAARTAYWLLAVFGAGLFGILVDPAVGRRVRPLATRVVAVSLIITPPVTVYVYALNALVLGLPRRPWLLPQLAWQVFVVMVLIMGVRSLLWRRVIETRTVIAPPLPEAERQFRQRLSARRRAAQLVAVEAEDHYVRVHTNAGSELLSMRFSDAMGELSRVHGHRLHRSWWAAADAIESVRWNRGSGEARLKGGMVVPVSRRHAAAVREAGWQ